MIFRDNIDIQKFLKDDAFFANTDCYCLGASRTSAAEIIREMLNSTGLSQCSKNDIEKRETAKDVGMDITGTNETSK